jgi:hypothetical protein
VQPHQKRVVEEKQDLDDRLSRLRDFISTAGGVFKSLSDAEKDRLRRQEKAMTEYSNILQERVENF